MMAAIRQVMRAFFSRIRRRQAQIPYAEPAEPLMVSEEAAALAERMLEDAMGLTRTGAKLDDPEALALYIGASPFEVGQKVIYPGDDDDTPTTYVVESWDGRVAVLRRKEAEDA